MSLCVGAGGVRCKICAQKDCNYMKSLFMLTMGIEFTRMKTGICKVVKIVSILFSIF